MPVAVGRGRLGARRAVAPPPRRSHRYLTKWRSRRTSPGRSGRTVWFGGEGQYRRVMDDRAGHERFELLDRLVRHPARPDAQWFADAFADHVTDTSFGLADPVGP